MAGAAPTAKPAPFLRPLDLVDRGLLLAESALSVVIVMVMLLVAIVVVLMTIPEPISRFVDKIHALHGVATALAGWGHAVQENPSARRLLGTSGDVLMNGTIWAAFLGASFATRGRRHLAIDVLGRLLPDRWRRVTVGISATLGAVVAFALARGIYEALMHVAADVHEQALSLQRDGATLGTVDQSYQFQFAIPGGFLLISVRLLLHAFHEFAAALRDTAPVTPVATPAGSSDPPVAYPPVAYATASEIGIALVSLMVLAFLARGSTVFAQLSLCVVLAALTLGVPLILRWRRGSLAPTAPVEPMPAVEFRVAHLAIAAACVVAVLVVARVGIAHIRDIPTLYGVLFFAGMAILGAPLFTFLGGLALFLWAHGSIDVQPQTLANSVEDALGPHFGRMSVLPTIPVFTLAGYLMSESKTPQRLVRVARAFLGWMPGGLAVVCLFASAFFTIFSGASGITIVAIGGLLYPALVKDKYPEKFSLGLVTTGGALGITFPPCLPLIVYGIVAGLQEVPHGHERLELQKFLLAGIIPGLLTIVVLAVYAVIVGVVSKVPRSNFDAGEARAALWEAKWEVLLPVFLLGGLVTGIFNPSQAAAFTAFYVLLIEVFIYKDLSITRDLPRIIPESMILVGAIFVKLCAATVLTAYFIQAQTADKLFEWLTCGRPALDYMHAHADTIGTCREAVDQLARVHQGSGGIIHSQLSFLIALNVFLLVVGMLMDIFSAIVVVVPLIAGIALHFNINPYHLGIVFLLNLEIGYLMPPMGLNLFIAGFRFNRPVPDLYRMVLPFIALFGVALLVTTYVPKLTLMMVPGQTESSDMAPTEAPAGTAPPPTTAVAPTAVTDAASAGDAAADDCTEQRENESFADFDRRCNITGAHPPAPTAPPPAAPAQTDCDEPRENEAFPAFNQRCHITPDAPPAAAQP